MTTDDDGRRRATNDDDGRRRTATDEEGRRRTTTDPNHPKSLTFSHRFPGSTVLLEDTTYEIYFEVFDSYPFSEPNSARSQVFTYRSRTKAEIESQQAKEQYESLLNVEQSQSNSKDIEKELEHILKKQRQQNS